MNTNIDYEANGDKLRQRPKITWKKVRIDEDLGSLHLTK